MHNLDKDFSEVASERIAKARSDAKNFATDKLVVTTGPTTTVS
jgi:hypothetical protein